LDIEFCVLPVDTVPIVFQTEEDAYYAGFET
jgi:hypothetical protein